MGNSTSFQRSTDAIFSPFWRYLCWYSRKDNRVCLQKELQQLRYMRDDVVSKIKYSGQQILPEVKEWICIVYDVQRKAYDLFDEIDNESRHGLCSLISAPIDSDKVDMMLEQVQTMISKGPRPPFSVLRVRMWNIQPHCWEQLLDSTWGGLMEEGVGVLSISGRGGVGKTTLLHQIHKRFSEANDYGFDLVIFVIVASNCIQDEIGRYLCLEWEQETVNEKAAEIFRVLNSRKFILLLDDLWEEVDLKEMGVPYPRAANGCKIVFTTRSNASQWKWVDAKIEVGILTPEAAWDLFEEVVGESTLISHRDILPLARIVAGKCYGLPLALRVVGQSMAGKKTISEWRCAVHASYSSAPRILGLQYEVLPILQVSYDNLPGENFKSCFQYCALFPESIDIRKQELIDYWVGEGFLVDEANGCEVVTHLVRACLLVEVESGYYVKMNSIVRVMALRIVSDLSRLKGHYVVERDDMVNQMPKFNDGIMVRRISVRSTQIENISDSPQFSELTTLFLKDNKKLERISGCFFWWMQSLAVLDMSHNVKLSELPEEISLLVSLRYLNLSWTSIKYLPKRLEELFKLIHLDLEFTVMLQSICISGLLELRVLRFYGSAATIDISLLENLEHLEDLKILTMTLKEVYVLEAFLRSKLADCTYGLHLEGLTISVQSFAASFGALGSLLDLQMINCDILESNPIVERSIRHKHSPSSSSTQIRPWFNNLSSVKLFSCSGIRDLTWLIYAANLESLRIYQSNEMEEVLSEDKAESVNVEEPFQKLQILHLYDLNELNSIYWEPLSFPKLQKVIIGKCPQLHKLPLSSMSVERIDDLRIVVEEEDWIQRVEWESGAQERFQPTIRPFVRQTWCSRLAVMQKKKDLVPQANINGLDSI